MLNQSIILIVILLIIIIIFLNNKKEHNKKEHYDARISDVTDIDRCANICSSVYGCGGFAFDPNNKKCYISKYPLTVPPIPAQFSDGYNRNYTYCNKALPILSDVSINNDLYVDNKIYDCFTNKAESVGKKYFDIGKKGTDIQTNDVYGIKSDSYKIQQITWPTSQTDIKFDDKLNYIYENNEVVYEADNQNEHLGLYLNPSMCLTDTDLNKCLKDCTNNRICEGVEYNVKYKNYENVCCPKSKIQKIIKRRPVTKYGTYYSKTLNYPTNEKNVIVI
jgi:hypothetical protein